MISRDRGSMVTPPRREINADEVTKGTMKNSDIYLNFGQ